MRALTHSIAALALMAACGNTDRPLRDLRAAGAGPDEFKVIPVGPLQVPPTTALPQPTPGGSNLTDPDPRRDAITALGGSAAAQRAGSIPAIDAGLVAATGRYGVDPSIRALLAAEDAALLEGARRSNIFNPLGRDRYFPTYARQALDASSEAARLRALGVRVPAPLVAEPQRPQPRAQGASAPATAPQEQPTGLLQGLFGPRGGPEQDCVLTTAGPGNELRRVCTPVEPDRQ